MKIYRDNGGKAGVGVDTERWDTAQDPAAGEAQLSSEDEKKRFPDSSMRRRQSSDVLPTSLSHGSDRPRLSQSPSLGPGSPMRDRFGGLTSSRRRESSDQTPTIPRKLSLSSTQGFLGGGGQPSPRTRGPTSAVDSPIALSGDSWMARRQALKASNRGDGGPESMDRQDSLGGTSSKGDGNDVKGDPLSQGTLSMSGSTQGLASGLSDLSLNNAGGSMIHDSSGLSNTGPPPGISDPSSVQWSYLDPQGQVQGPFRADIMQKWHDDGYFTQDLLIKRLTIDLDWMTVAELRQRTNSPKLFLTQIPPNGPPGLSRTADSPRLHFASIADQNMMISPHQPAPLRSLRASALESYVGNGSNPSDSPTSSFGAGRSSTDPSAFGGRAANPYFQDPAGFGGSPDVFGRRNTFGDGFRSGSADLTPGAGQGVDHFGYNARYNGPSNAWPPQNNPIGAGFGSSAPGGERYSSEQSGGYLPASGLVGALNGTNIGDMQYGGNNGLAGVDYISSGNGEHGSGLGRYGEQLGGSPYQSYNQTIGYNSPTVPSSFNQYAASPQQQQQYPSTFDTPSKISQGHRPIGHDSPLLQNATAWPLQHQQAPDSPAISRPTAYESSLRSAAIAQPSAWGQKPVAPAPAASLIADQSQWPTEQSASPAQVWPNSTSDRIVSSLTISNVGKHNQQQDQLVTSVLDSSQDVAALGAIEHSVPATVDEVAAIVTPVGDSPATAAVPPTKTRKGSVPQVAGQPPSKPSASSPITLKAPTPPPPTALPSILPAKPAWSVEDEKKAKVTPSVSLREIQDIEAKKAEARKVAERDRERAARAAAVATASSSGAVEESASFTATWGLSGARGSAPKESLSASSSAAVPAAAWTAAAKAPAPTKKKTMKEIQEEEEKRKAAVKAAAPAAATPPRRGYADSTGKTAPVAPIAGGAWTTVGTGGKSGPAPPRPAATPTPAASTSTTGSVPRVNGAAPRVAAPTVAKAVSVARSVDDTPVAPSHDFLKWLSDSLKGLNTSVNVEEIMSMLLTFPIDADSSTLEIISDLIYANSTTLDGRRFASEFASKRKVDAASRPKSNGGNAGSNKPISIAEVVKAQPKPATAEWGGFKVVNKKKNKSRA